MKSGNGMRIRLLLLSAALILSLSPVNTLAAAGAKDIDGHPAASAIETCYTYGIMEGDGNGMYTPDRDITRAEFAAMVNRAFGYDTLTMPELAGYTDIPPGKWYAGDIQTAIALGIIEGYGDGIAAPEDKITREQAGVVLGRVLRLDGSYPVEGSGYFTRGETAQLLLNVCGVIVDGEWNTDGKEFENVTIRKSGSYLANAIINGDLFITEGVGDGDVYLDNVWITGRLLLTGGGEHSVHVRNLTVGQNIVVDKPSVLSAEPVRFRAIQSNNTTVIFEGKAREVMISDDITVLIDPDDEMTVFNMFAPTDPNARPQLVIGDNAEIGKIVAAAPAEISGGGAVNKVEVQSKDVEVAKEVKAEAVEAEKSVEVTVGGETKTGEGITNPTTIRESEAMPEPPAPAPEPIPARDPTPAPEPPPEIIPHPTGGGDGGGTTTTNAKTPAIGTQPQSASVVVGTTHTLSVSASITDSGTLSYQWYSNTAASASGGTAIPGATSASYAAPINTAGTFYYYVVVTNTNNGVNGTKTASVTSNAVTLTVNAALKTVAGIAVKTQPSKLSYTHGDTLDLSGLEVTLTYDDSSGEDVALADFAAKNISASPSNGAALSRTAHNGGAVTISCGGQTADTDGLTIAQKAITIDVSSMSGVTLTPLPGENTTTLTVTLGGFVSDTDAAAAGFGAAFGGLNYTIGTVTANKTKTCTITLTLPTSTAFQSGSATVIVDKSGSLSSDYTYTGGQKTSSVNIKDGFYHLIPVTTENIAVFNTFANGGAYGGGLHYELTENITLDVPTAGSSNWTPIADFNGSFDGKGYCITNLTIAEADEYYVGMFKKVEYFGCVKNLTLNNVCIEGSSDVGGITGMLEGTYGASVSNCAVNGAIIGEQRIGGIAGVNQGGTILNCYTSGTVTIKAGSEYSGAGGIAGQNSSSGLVQNCYSHSDVTGFSEVGGIVGTNFNTIENCYATGKVVADNDDIISFSYAGGIAGVNWFGTIENCVALNESIFIDDMEDILWEASVGRITGSFDDGGGYVGALRENYAWSGLTAEYSDGAKTLDTGADKVDGADITTNEQLAALWSSLGFNDPWWSGKLPTSVPTTFAMPTNFNARREIERPKATIATLNNLLTA